ncbi:sigma-54-dependent transcriptional regulator [Desulfonatronum lacustre]|uniref:sigma-54-dependent transcriptional regulator n=1 Tax=Desulfonatronum lacustre TaxID=66849 RepID=UPI000A00B430
MPEPCFHSDDSGRCQEGKRTLVLIIDDDKIICNVLSKKILRLGYDVQCAHSLRKGLELVERYNFDVVFLDVRLPDGNGLEALPTINRGSKPPEVIIITGESDPDGAELAIRNGAWDYVQKPSSLKSMLLPLIRALQYREKKPCAGLKALKVNGIVGRSPRIKACFDLLAQAAESDMSVLVTGETGTGKELFARAIHENSARAKGRFVIVDCATLHENLVESELFGSVKGAFTGADSLREGLIIKADGGTLFLDEVGELPLSVQKKFLRVLQEHRFRKVGDNREIKSNFRLVCATNQDLEAMTQAGAFRQDLLFRLRSMHIQLPALIDRREDIKELTVHHMNTVCEQYGLPTKGMSPEFTEALMNYDWPGNVRELFGTLENVLVSARKEPILYPQHLPMEVRIKAKKACLRKGHKSSNHAQLPDFSEVPRQVEPEERGAPVEDMEAPVVEPALNSARAVPDFVFSESESVKASALMAKDLPTLRELREQTVSALEREYIHEILRRVGHDLPEVLRLSGISRARFYELLKKHSIPFR